MLAVINGPAASDRINFEVHAKGLMQSLARASFWMSPGESFPTSSPFKDPVKQAVLLGQSPGAAPPRRSTPGARNDTNGADEIVFLFQAAVGVARAFLRLSLLFRATCPLCRRALVVGTHYRPCAACGLSYDH